MKAPANPGSAPTPAPPLRCQAAEPTPAYNTVPSAENHTIHFDGTINRRRYLIRVNGIDVWVPGQLLRVLWLFVTRRAEDPAGWVHVTELGADTNPHRTISRVRRLLALLAPYPGAPSDGWVENNGHGCYRLSLLVVATWDQAKLSAECPDIVTIR